MEGAPLQRHSSNNSNSIIMQAFNAIIGAFGGVVPPEEKSALYATGMFIRNFEEKYGESHPKFFEGSYEQAISKARSRFKFLLVYLHSPMHVDTDTFCKHVLCSEEMINFVDDNFILWGGDVTVSQGFDLTYRLGACTFPFLAVLCNVDGRVELADRIEPRALSQSALLELLLAITETKGPILIAARSASEERQRDRLLREQQDLAYNQSLREDQEKELKKFEETQKKEQLEKSKDEESKKKDYDLNKKKKILKMKKKKFA